MTKKRLRDLGITLGQLPTGPLNAITDVAGVRVGHSTVIQDQPHVVRTGVTAIWPAHDIYERYCTAGFFSFNGNGELTGSHWLNEQGLLAAPIALTNTHAVGVVRDAICVDAAQRGVDNAWHLPVAGETWDGWLSDAESFPVTQQIALDAIGSATDGPVEEGCVGGGTGMITHEFKGGIGTASRRLPTALGGWTVGVLVQSNYGVRGLLRCGNADAAMQAQKFLRCSNASAAMQVQQCRRRKKCRTAATSAGGHRWKRSPHRWKRSPHRWKRSDPTDGKVHRSRAVDSARMMPAFILPGISLLAARFILLSKSVRLR